MKDNKIQFCTRCLYSSQHALGITFDKQGLCSGCIIHDEKNSLNWDYRIKKLKKLIKPYKSKSRKTYDCIVPVSGSNDSHYIVHIVKNILNLNPLLVHYNKYFNTPIGISNLANLRIKFDADIISKNVNMNSIKKIVKHTLFEYHNIYWHILAGHSVFPLEAAIKYKVPLIIWGAHQGLEQVGMFSHEHEVEMTRRYREDHDLFGIEADKLLQLENELKEEDIWQFRYPDDKQIHSIGVRGIYLGNYIRWDPTAQHKMMIKKYNFKSAKLPRTFDTYDHIDCFNYMNIHDKLKIFKRGYSKITDHVCREIRHGRLNRHEGVNLIKYYESQKIENLDLFCEWLGISKNSMIFLLNRSRNKKFWIEKDLNNFKFQGPSVYMYKKQFSLNYEKKLKNKILNNFIATDLTKLKESKNFYMFYGKGIN